MKNMKVEAEGGEIILQNSFGDLAIIPKNEVPNVKYFLDTGRYDEIDRIIGKLPTPESYVKKPEVNL